MAGAGGGGGSPTPWGSSDLEVVQVYNRLIYSTVYKDFVQHIFSLPRGTTAATSR